MTGPTEFQSATRHEWMTLNVVDVGDKFILEEPVKRSLARRIVETGFILLVAVLLLSSYLVFILPDLPLSGPYSAVSVSVLTICGALFLYAFGTRGHALQVGVDRARKQVWLCRLNSKGQARIITHFPRHDVMSLFVQRPRDGAKDALLMARLSGKATPAILLRGTVQDIETAHGVLCRELRPKPVAPMARQHARAAAARQSKGRIFGKRARNQPA